MAHATTVVISRAVVPGAEAEADRWLNTLVQAARQAPGYVRSDIQPPGPQHPGEWVVVYEFDSPARLDAWLASSDRTDLIAQEAEFFTHATQQRVARTPEDSSVTAIASFKLEPGTAEAFEAHFARLLLEIEGFDGFLRAEHIPPVGGVQDETAIIFSFESRPQLDAWLNSPRRAELLGEIEPLLATRRTVNVVGGFAGWFNTPTDRPVKTWKQATLVLLALYPTSLALGLVRDWLLPTVASPVGVLFGNVLGVAVLSWVLMPRLTRAFSAWLHR